MMDCGDANRLSAIGQLIENPVRADPERVQAAELSPQGIASERIALEQVEGILDCIYQRPAQLEQVTSGSPGENESRQRSAGSRSTLG